MRCTISRIYFDKELYMFQTDLLSTIRSLNTVYTAIGICHAKLLKAGKITSVSTYSHINTTDPEVFWSFRILGTIRRDSTKQRSGTRCP
jgi:hypothetical protein